MVIGSGVLSDCWHSEPRGKTIGIYSLAPLLGPALGPLVGACIAEKTTWRWVLWSTNITAVLLQISGLFFPQETFPPTLIKRKADPLRKETTLIKRKADRLRKETGNEKLYTEFESDKTLGNILRIAAARASRMLFTQPIIQVIAVYLAYLLGMFYLILSTFPTIWQVVYQESVGIAGLNYVFLGLEFFVGAQTAGQVVSRSNLPPLRASEQRHKPSIVPNPPDVRGVLSHFHRPILVRLVRRSKNTLDSAEHRNHHIWCRSNDLHAVYANLYFD